MKKILFPTDFSESANNAFVYALKLADSLKAEIITLHVYEYPILDANYVEVPLYQAEVYQSLELANFENYKSQVPALHQIAQANGLGHVPLNNVLLEGDLVQNIATLVEKDNIDYVVMGTHGATGFTEFFFGTTTADVMTETSAFVLAIPDESKYQDIRKIGYAISYKQDEREALKRLLALADTWGAVVECLHVQTEGETIAPETVAAWKAGFGNNVNFHTLVSNDIEESIIDFTEAHRIDLVALLNHKRGFWESLFHTSLTKKLAFHLKTPLLALHKR
ncbi:universal stress protein [Flavobacterium sp.]|uniref:universal stress protein n=1 Tax=Flavobacterium sp. TaxID=239 RepID=UPI0026368C6F|nr:universal stress protein [Flavobacterium sp.]